MKFDATRKISLGSIHPMWQFESEELAVHDADSPEEAISQLENWVKARELFYKELALAKKEAKITGMTAPIPAPPAPMPSIPETIANPQPVLPTALPPILPPNTVNPNVPTSPGESINPPASFN